MSYPFNSGAAARVTNAAGSPPPPVKIDLSKSSPANEQPFFMVWREFGGVPTVKHFHINEAEDEATRLARENPGVKFFVLASLASAILPKQPIPPVVFTRAFGF